MPSVHLNCLTSSNFSPSRYTSPDKQCSWVMVLMLLSISTAAQAGDAWQASYSNTIWGTPLEACELGEAQARVDDKEAGDPGSHWRYMPAPPPVSPIGLPLQSDYTCPFSLQEKLFGNSWITKENRDEIVIYVPNSCAAPATGDVNGDCIVNVIDIFLMEKDLLGLSTLDASAIIRADVYPESTGDGQITLSDLLTLFNLVLTNS